PHPIPTFGDDGQRPFLRGQDGGIHSGDLGFGKSEILPDGLICRIASGPQSRTAWIAPRLGTQPYDHRLASSV
ncbi:MAG: hypothetical protein Q8M18_01420, partial [Bradyrhizobium sp.]|nr:hypothetical protein [Bradyrhizobium sp.]